MAIAATRLMFQLGSRVIAGNLGGKSLCCAMRPAQGGTLPPAGDYEILPPMNDPVYGRVALMVPVGGSGAVRAQMAMQKCLVTAKLFMKPDWGTPAVATKFETPPAVGMKFERPAGVGMKFERPPAVGTKFERPGANGGQVFVLSNRPVLGRNCIVISSGFADLMDGLQTSGGARVTVV